eukprot:15212072-Alexandrium_andersonii.AAC.1
MQHAREGDPVPRHVQARMGRGTAVFDLTAAGEQLEEQEDSSGVNDADISDIPHFRGPDSDDAPTEPGLSGVRQGRLGGQTDRDDITGA